MNEAESDLCDYLELECGYEGMQASELITKQATEITTLRTEKARAYAIGYDSAMRDYEARIAEMEAENARLRAGLAFIENMAKLGRRPTLSLGAVIGIASHARSCLSPDHHKKNAALAPKDTADHE